MPHDQQGAWRRKTRVSVRAHEEHTAHERLLALLFPLRRVLIRTRRRREPRARHLLPAAPRRMGHHTHSDDGGDASGHAEKLSGEAAARHDRLRAGQGQGGREGNDHGGDPPISDGRAKVSKVLLV